MNRQEALTEAAIAENDMWEGENDRTYQSFSEVINKIYNDFESQVCENCIHADLTEKFGELDFSCYLVSNGNICKFKKG